LRVVKLVIESLKKRGLKTSYKKSPLVLRTIELLGNDIAHNNITPKKDRIKKILEAKLPETIQDLQRWIGVVNYLRAYTPEFSLNMEELYKLIDLKSVPASYRKKKNNE
jgi:hypothetical protein